MKQRIKLTRSKFTYANGRHNVYPYVVSETCLAGNGGYSLITEDALLIGWSTEATGGNQYVVGIVLLESRQVITAQLSSIVFV